MDPRLDQAQAGIKDMIAILGECYKIAVYAGFSPEQAMQLTVNFQTFLMNGNKNN